MAWIIRIYFWSTIVTLGTSVFGFVSRLAYANISPPKCLGTCIPEYVWGGNHPYIVLFQVLSTDAILAVFFFIPICCIIYVFNLSYFSKPVPNEGIFIYYGTIAIFFALFILELALSLPNNPGSR